MIICIEEDGFTELNDALYRAYDIMMAFLIHVSAGGGRLGEDGFTILNDALYQDLNINNDFLHFPSAASPLQNHDFTILNDAPHPNPNTNHAFLHSLTLNKIECSTIHPNLLGGRNKETDNWSISEASRDAP